MELTSYERFVRRIGGEPVDRTPNFNLLMTYVAHFIGGIPNLNVFARRHDEAISAAKNEIASPRKIPDLRPGTEDTGVRNDVN